jgi:hypothetical protein
MGRKKDDACLAKAGDDEPIFVLRAQDLTAPAVIGYWLELVERLGGRLSNEKRAHAEVCMWEMQAWPNRKLPD